MRALCCRVYRRRVTPAACRGGVPRRLTRLESARRRSGDHGMQLADSSFIVTGGASGLGAATVRALAQGGARVVIADLKDSDGQALARELGEAARFVRTDVTDEASSRAAVDAAVAQFGGVQGLVNCAGIVH